MRIAFYVSGKSGRLKKYLQQASEAQIGSIVCVISDDEIEADLSLILEKYNIKASVKNYKDILSSSKEEKNLQLSDFIMKQLDENKIDYCISFGKHILKGELLSKYENRIINFHPSVLPLFPGMNAIDQAVMHGNTLLVGNTAHFIDEGVDSGPIIMQSVIPMRSFIDSDKDYDVVLDLQITMLNQLLDIIDKGALSVVEGVVKIEGADYNSSSIFPVWKIKE